MPTEGRQILVFVILVLFFHFQCTVIWRMQFLGVIFDDVEGVRAADRGN